MGKATDIGVGAALGGPIGAGLGAVASGGGFSSTQPQANAGIPAALQPLWNQLYGMGSSFGSNPQNQINPLGYAPSPLYNQASQYLGNQFGPGGLIGQSQGTLGNILSPQFNNPATNQNLQQYLRYGQNQFQKGLGGGLDQLSAIFGQSGQGPGSGAFLNNAEQFTRNALSDYTGQTSGLLNNQYNQGISQQLQALTMANNPLSMAMGAGGFGQLPQQLAQQQNQAQIGLNQIPFQMLMQLLSGTPLAYPQYGPSPLSQTLGGIGSLLGGAGSLGQGVGAIMGA